MTKLQVSMFGKEAVALNVAMSRCYSSEGGYGILMEKLECFNQFMLKCERTEALDEVFDYFHKLFASEGSIFKENL